MLTFGLNWDSMHGQLFENQTKRGGGDGKYKRKILRHRRIRRVHYALGGSSQGL